jgi:hypothetical protein
MAHLLDSLSLPAGKGPNEDAWGWRGDAASGAAWMIDGATGLDDVEHVAEGPTDAAWYARALSDALARMAPPGDDPRTAFVGVVEGLAARWRASVPDPDAVPAHALPSAALLWCRWTRADAGWTLDLAWLGDCLAVLAPPAGPVKVFNRGALEAADGRLRARIGAASAAGTSDGDMLRALMPELRARRAMANRPGGYWVMGLAPEAAAHMKRASTEAPRGSRLLLMSDGFYRLVDHFALFDDRTLVDAATGLGLAALGARLRAAEQTSGIGTVARVKPTDDATAVLLALD